MKRLALLFALIFSMLVASVHPAEAALVDGAAHVVHGDHEGASNDNDHGNQQGDDGIGHHHCPTCWIADAMPRVKPILHGAAALVMPHYASLPSRSDDPLLEPPAA